MMRMAQSELNLLIQILDGGGLGPEEEERIGKDKRRQEEEGGWVEKPEYFCVPSFF